jgi:hypothetical protein
MYIVFLFNLTFLVGTEDIYVIENIVWSVVSLIRVKCYLYSMLISGWNYVYGYVLVILIRWHFWLFFPFKALSWTTFSNVLQQILPSKKYSSYKSRHYKLKSCHYKILRVCCKFQGTMEVLWSALIAAIESLSNAKIIPIYLKEKF